MALSTLQNEHLRCEIDPAAGASIVTLAARLKERWVPVLRATPREAIESGNSSEMASFVLLPYSNRIANAHFDFEGKSYELRPNTEDGHTIHGDVRKRPWQVTDSGPTWVRLRFESRAFSDINFPFPFNAAVGYEIDGNGFRAELELENAGTERMPAGMGHHPYYSRTLTDPNEEVEVQATFTREYEGLVPTAPAKPLSPRHDFSSTRALRDDVVDCCFAGWDGKAVITWPGSGVRAEIDCDPPLRHIILFTPPGKPYFALEPVSNANNGFNLLASGDTDAGVRVLEPGQTMAASFRLRVVA